VLNPTLFNIVLHDINKGLDQNTKISIYVDDITIWTSHSYVTVVNENLQKAVDKTVAWTEKWGLKISKQKAECCLFTTIYSKKCHTCNHFCRRENKI
jgi:hypothetical protein